MSEILVTGDIYLGSSSVEKLAEMEASNELFGDFSSIIKNSDFSITNLESPVTDDSTGAIIKAGPILKSSKKSLNVLKSVGFDLVTLANNHILDYGKQGLVSTLDKCQEIGLNSVGAGVSIEIAKKPFVVDLQGKSIAIINVAENEFSTIGATPYGANPLDFIENSYDIKEYKNNCDFVIVIVHGGREHYELPSPNFKKTLRFFADCGADAVLAHHTHCVSGYEIYKDTPIFYGLGNFHFKSLSDKKNTSLWNTGLAVKLILLKSGAINFELYPYRQCRGVKNSIEMLSGMEKDAFLEELDVKNKIIKDEIQLNNHWRVYISNQKKAYITLLFVKNKWIRKFINRKIIPLNYLMNKKHETHVINLIRCETHREILLDSLLLKQEDLN